MAEHEIATALELMQGGLKFEHDADGWWWVLNGDASLWFNTELDAVRDFFRLYAQTRLVADEPQPAPFNLGDFMMDGIQALVRAAAEEMRSRGDGFNAETVAGALARVWHDFEARRQAGRWPYEDTPMSDDYGG